MASIDWWPTWPAILGGVVTVLLTWLWSRRAKYITNVPRNPTPIWFGDMFTGLNNFDRFHDWMIEIHEKLGHTWGWAAPFGEKGIITVSPQNIEYILKTNFENFEKGQFFSDIVGEFLGRGIFVVDGAEWREKRKVASHMFSQKVLRDDMAAVFKHHGAALMELLDQLPRDSVINIQDYFFRFTLDSICEIAFGQQINTLHLPDQDFPRAFDRVQYLVNHRSYTPTFQWKLKRFFNIGTEKELADNIRFVHDYCNRMVQSRLSEGESMLRKYPDLLSRFITEARDRGEELSNNYLRDVVLNFMLAGRDTTACMLSWALYELMKNPNEERKLLDELATIVKSDSKALWVPSYEECNKLDYFDAFMREVLRLHPSVPQDTKLVVNECVLPDGGYRIPPKTMVTYFIYGVGRSKRIWGEDALEFKPSRWLDPKKPTPSQFEYPVFNAGPRVCLGQHVAMLEGKALFAALVHRYRFKSHVVETPGKPLYLLTIVLPFKDGLPVSLERR